MSRSIGDNIAASVGVNCEPEITCFKFTSKEKFIVIASDGLWEQVSNGNTVRVVSKYWQDNNIEGACGALMKLAAKRWEINEGGQDDITIVIVFLR